MGLCYFNKHAYVCAMDSKLLRSGDAIKSAQVLSTFEDKEAVLKELLEVYRNIDEARELLVKRFANRENDEDFKARCELSRPRVEKLSKEIHRKIFPLRRNPRWRNAWHVYIHWAKDHVYMKHNYKN